MLIDSQPPATTRATVRHALSQLVYENLIVRQVGRGSFVSERPQVTYPIENGKIQSFEEQVGLAGAVVTYRLLSYGIENADRQVADKLGIPKGHDVYRLKRLRLIKERPVCLELRFLPVSLAEKFTTEMLGKRAFLDAVSEIIGMRVPTNAISIVAESADKETAALLHVSEGSALIVRENTFFDIAAHPIHYGRSIYPGDIRLEYLVGKQPTVETKAR